MTTKRLTGLLDEYNATIKAFDAYRKLVSDAAKEEHEEKKKEAVHSLAIECWPAPQPFAVGASCIATHKVSETMAKAIDKLGEAK